MILVPSAVFGITSYPSWTGLTNQHFICDYVTYYELLRTTWYRVIGDFSLEDFVYSTDRSILAKCHMQVSRGRIFFTRSILISHTIESYHRWRFVLFAVQSPTQSVHLRSPATVTINNAEYYVVLRSTSTHHHMSTLMAAIAVALLLCREAVVNVWWLYILVTN